MRSELGDEIRLKHILDAIEEIEKYLIEVDFPTFIENSMMRFACIKQMEIIGEASNHVSEELKSKFTDIEWAQIVGMRNVFAHEYFGIDSSLVWQIIKNDIPELKDKIKTILRSIQ
ncbi:MAG: HepT-like ribonuclease domain-containing protein [Minisyncoccia bacterium]